MGSQIRFNKLPEGPKAELSVTILGNDYDVLEKLLGEVLSSTFLTLVLLPVQHAWVENKTARLF